MAHVAPLCRFSTVHDHDPTATVLAAVSLTTDITDDITAKAPGAIVVREWLGVGLLTTVPAKCLHRAPPLSLLLVCGNFSFVLSGQVVITDHEGQSVTADAPGCAPAHATHVLSTTFELSQ